MSKMLQQQSKGGNGMSYDMVIKNGKVVLLNEVVEVEIGIQGGKIAAIGKDLPKTEVVIDAEGMYVLPGVIDGHVHLCEPGRTNWEGFETGTKALASGGTTCYVDMPLNNLPATTDGETIKVKLASAQGKNYVDYALYGGLMPNNLDKLHELDEAGVAAYKCFVSTCGFNIPGDFKNIDDYVLYKGMLELKKLNQTLSIHCENAVMCDRLAEEAINQGRNDMDAYMDSRPIFAEVEAVRRVLYFGKITGCRLHFVHLSCAEAVEEVVKARNEGMDVTVESCPHYLCLTREDCVELGGVAKCSPPVRDKYEVDKLWEQLKIGNIDILTSDHSPCPPDMKENDENDMFKVWGGMSACQNILDIMFDEAVQKRNMNVCQLMKVLSTNPAKIFGLKDKGEIAIGKDADIVLLKPMSFYTLKAEDLQYKHKHSPYIGKEIGCQVMKTFVRGNVVYDKDHGITGTAMGKHIKRGLQ